MELDRAQTRDLAVLRTEVHPALDAPLRRTRSGAAPRALGSRRRSRSGRLPAEDPRDIVGRGGVLDDAHPDTTVGVEREALLASGGRARQRHRRSRRARPPSNATFACTLTARAFGALRCGAGLGGSRRGRPRRARPRERRARRGRGACGIAAVGRGRRASRRSREGRARRRGCRPAPPHAPRIEARARGERAPSPAAHDAPTRPPAASTARAYGLRLGERVTTRLRSIARTRPAARSRLVSPGAARSPSSR